MALKIAESAPKPDEDKGIPLDGATPEESEKVDQEVDQELAEDDAMALKQKEATKAMTKAKETLEETPPSGNNSDEWGLLLTDRFNVVRQKESFMLVEHRPSQDRDGNPTTKTLKTYHPSVEQIIGKMTKVHTLDLLEQEEVDKFVDGVADLSKTLRETVEPLLKGAQKNHESASNMWKDHLPTFLGRLDATLRDIEKTGAFEGPDGEKAITLSALKKGIEQEFKGEVVDENS